SFDGAIGGYVFLCRLWAGGVPAACAQLRRRAAATGRGARPGLAAALARGRGEAQTRPEPQVRSTRARQSRRRAARRGARHAAPVLRARIASAPRYGLARRAPFALTHHQL